MPFRGRRARPRRGGDLETEVEITLEEADAGARRTVEFQQLEPCGDLPRHRAGREGAVPDVRRLRPRAARATGSR